MAGRIVALALLFAAFATPAAARESGSDRAVVVGSGELVETAVAALRDDPVYVHPQAQDLLSPGEARQLRARIAATGAGPMYIAVLPAVARNEAGGDTNELLRELVRGVRRSGTYAVVAGNQFRAGSTLVKARPLADQAFRQHRSEGVAATLLAFVDLVGKARDDEGASAAPAEGGGGDDERSPLGALTIIAAIAGGIGFLAVRRRRQQREELAPVREAAEEDLLALAEDIRALDLDVEMPGADATAKEEYAQALRSYERADAALERARRPEDLEAVTTALEEGRFAMASAKARLEGRTPPERRAPCFFDPRHGPSDRDVEWAPPGGTPRPVPACEADAQMVERGLEPATRQVMVDGERVPYWAAPPMYGPWAGGYFAPFGLFPALMFGSMLGAGVGLGFPATAEADPGGAFGDGDLGDFGGGDFGGDFGGDLGGGDFGGGDFGGGDF